MGRPAREEYLADPCNVCGAIKGQRCTDSTGKTLSPSKSHKDRMQVWAVKNEMDDDRQVMTIAHAIELAHTDREGRIRMVLDSIAFARRIGTTQDLIDHHLAEMIVDAEFAG